jgi:hypothetical protein
MAPVGLGVGLTTFEGEGLAETEGDGEGEAEGDSVTEGLVADGEPETMIAGPSSSEHPAIGSAHAIASAAKRGAPRHPSRMFMASTPVAARR